jgi:hypothetical protein
MDFFKRRLPLIIVAVMGTLMICQYYVPTSWSRSILSYVMRGVRIIAAFTLLIGVYSLCRVHYMRIRRQGAGWGYSIVMYISFVAMVVCGVAWGTASGKPFMWIFNNVTTPLASTVFSILAFYIVSAVYRAFRAKTFEATIMLVAAIIIMIGRIPLGDMMSEHLPNWLRTSTLTFWLFQVPVVAAKRAVILGIALGVIATSLRIILGIERGYMGGAD